MTILAAMIGLCCFETTRESCRIRILDTVVHAKRIQVVVCTKAKVSTRLFHYYKSVRLLHDVPREINRIFGNENTMGTGNTSTDGVVVVGVLVELTKKDATFQMIAQRQSL